MRTITVTFHRVVESSMMEQRTSLLTTENAMTCVQIQMVRQMRFSFKCLHLDFCVNSSINAHCVLALNGGCKVWTRTKRAVSGGSQVGECWLRNYQPAALKCDYCDSGVMSCEVYDNIDYTTTDDILNKGGPSAITDTNEDCCALCYGSARTRLHSQLSCINPHINNALGYNFNSLLSSVHCMKDR